MKPEFLKILTLMEEISETNKFEKAQGSSDEELETYQTYWDDIEYEEGSYILDYGFSFKDYKAYIKYFDINLTDIILI